MTMLVDIWAKTGNMALPGNGPVLIWGFASSVGANAQIPGPIIEVTENDTLELTLHNNLTFPTSITFPGQEFTPQPVKNPEGTLVSFNSETAPNSSRQYIISPNRPGVFLYESGTSSAAQIQMGLYGVIVVRPPGYIASAPSTWTAYGQGTGSEYDIEKILVIGEVDTSQHTQLDAGNQPDSYKPDFFLINGRSFPDTISPDSSGSQPYSSKIAARTGQRVLLRIINAGFTNHNIRFQIPDVRIVAVDSWPLMSASLDGTYRKNTITIGAGESYDLLFTAPPQGRYLIYDRSLQCTVNGNEFPGGIITVIEVA